MAPLFVQNRTGPFEFSQLVLRSSESGDLFASK